MASSKKNRLAWMVWLVLFASGLDAGCGGTPVAPAGLNGSSPPAPTVISLELQVPRQLTGPGDRMTLTLRAVFSDGSAKEAAKDAVWTIQFPQVLSVTNGEATGLAYGASSVVARYGGQSTGKTLVVTPPGTFAMTGRVREPGAGNLSGVQVTSRTTAATTSTTSDGFYSLGALPDRLLLFEKAGFEAVLADETSDEFPGAAMQRFLRAGLGETLAFTMAPNDVAHETGNGRCGPCRVFHIVDAAGEQVHLQVMVPAAMSSVLRMWTPEGVLVPASNGEFVADILADTNDLRLYVGWPYRAQSTSYTNVVVRATK